MASGEHGNVGIVGAGVMGFAMANNLRAAGYQVFGYDPVPAAQQRLREPAQPRDVRFEKRGGVRGCVR